MAEVSKRLKTLMLVSEKQRTELPSEVFIEDTIVRSDIEIGNELLISQYDVAFITKEYAQTYGVEEVKKIMSLFSKLTRTRIHYLIGIADISYSDNVMEYMYQEGNGNISRVNLSTMTIGQFRDMATEERKVTKTDGQPKGITERELQLMQDELTILEDKALTDYIVSNKGELLDVFNLTSTMLAKNTTLSNDVISNKSELESAKARLREIIAENNTLRDSRDRLASNNRELKKALLSQSNKIEDYNERVRSSRLVDTPTIKLDSTAPIVVYFKELEDVGFFSLFESLQYTLETTYGRNIKSVIIEPRSRDYFSLYERYGYETIEDRIPMERVIKYDKLVRYGNPKELLEIISNPEFRLEAILVYDRSLSDKVMIETDFMYTYYIGNTKENIGTLSIPDDAWISPVEGVYQTLEPLLGIDKLGTNPIVYNSYVSKHPFAKQIRQLMP